MSCKQNKCINCYFGQSITLTTAYCVHPNNYNKRLTDYQINTDAGYKCPLNAEMEDYISIYEEEQQLKEQISLEEQ